MARTSSTARPASAAAPAVPAAAPQSKPDQPQTGGTVTIASDPSAIPLSESFKQAFGQEIDQAGAAGACTSSC